ncbi:hypothetical protein R1flu_024919 [Riccia fluitans]|uniref:Uncharacterized protein n=1 Tax=Riccia fluitans TaxID=41844 RepID=A0ABD1XWE7_9MARC
MWMRQELKDQRRPHSSLAKKKCGKIIPPQKLQKLADDMNMTGWRAIQDLLETDQVSLLNRVILKKLSLDEMGIEATDLKLQYKIQDVFVQIAKAPDWVFLREIPKETTP